MYSLSARKDGIRLFLKPQTLSDLDNPAFIGVRQRHQDYLVETRMQFDAQADGEAAGLVIIQNNHYHVRLEKTFDKGESVVRVVQRINDEEQIMAQVPSSGDTLYLKIVERGRWIHFFCGETMETNQLIFENFDAKMLSTEITGGFVGCCIGLFATGNGIKSNNYSDFNWFEYDPILS